MKQLPINVTSTTATTRYGIPWTVGNTHMPGVLKAERTAHQMLAIMCRGREHPVWMGADKDTIRISIAFRAEHPWHKRWLVDLTNLYPDVILTRFGRNREFVLASLEVSR